jgi:hypothetical protein
MQNGKCKQEKQTKRNIKNEGKRRASQMCEHHTDRKKKGNSYRTSKRFF